MDTETRDNIIEQVDDAQRGAGALADADAKGALGEMVDRLNTAAGKLSDLADELESNLTDIGESAWLLAEMCSKFVRSAGDAETDDDLEAELAGFQNDCLGYTDDVVSYADEIAGNVNDAVEVVDELSRWFATSDVEREAVELLRDAQRTADVAENI